MGKKGRQSDPSLNTDDSTESCDENQNTSVCAHINKSVDLQRVKKMVARRGFLKDCEDCTRDPVQNGFEMNTDYEYDLSLWLCLKCGNQACGRSKNQHALQHWKTPHSDSHSLCVNTTIWNVWCYECDDEVNVTCRKKLLECVEYLKKHADTNIVKNQVVPLVNENKEIELEFHSIQSVGNVNSDMQKLPRTCGLTNLGNTCFFNSVMQCLGQTPYLLELLDETAQPGQHFHLPGGKLNPEDKESVILDPLEGDLEEWKPLTRYLAETLRELQSGRADVFTPRMLHSKLTLRLPQFGGGDQHDSHELLRHLLEAVREEDLRRYQAVILDKLGKLGLSKKTDPSTVEGEKRKIIKFYGQQASDLLLPTEQVFRGILVSTLQCQVCDHTSYREEFFLDLSLPIVEKQVPPVLRRKADELDDNKPSKHQLKKEKKATRKAKKHKTHRNMINCSNSNSPDSSNQNAENSESESDADVEDNTEDVFSTTTQSSNGLAKSSNESSLRDSVKGLESGYHSEKIENGSPSNRINSPISMSTDDSPQIGMRSMSPLNRCSVENSPSSSETNIDMGSPLLGRNSPTYMNDDLERPESRLSFVNKNMEVDLAHLSLLNDGDRNAHNKAEGLDNRLEEASKRLDDDDDKMEEDFDIDMWTGTMSPRYKCEEGECSVQSCLNQFTACELMTANNKVGCELCTKRHGGSQKKTIYTDARKQLLIYNPPAVLILHLKRFQVSSFRLSKMSKHVSFPILLDIAPFCSKRSQNLPTFEAGQTKVLYSLYGVVEHSGSLHGGHYVAYVKVRAKLEDNSYRWNFLPKNQKQKANNSPDMLKGAQGEPQIPPGKWYYVSDSHVSEVQESKVLKAQAYLLFYERIL